MSYKIERDGSWIWSYIWKGRCHVSGLMKIPKQGTAFLREVENDGEFGQDA